MNTADVAVIGAGQAGLAMSRLLTREGIGHVLLDRGPVAGRWEAERWDSLRLITPNWFARLPGHAYAGPEPEGFMTAARTAAYLRAYAAGFGAPVAEGAEVLRLAATGGGYRLATTAGDWQARAVVIATGACDSPAIPACAARLAPGIARLASRDYRRPAQIAPGGVLVVGASASGLQIARELAAAGRPVTLAVGRHMRVPRRHRGRDIVWLMDRAGILDDTAAQVPDLARAQRAPSLQLSGDGRTLDLGVLRAMGVRLAGRLLDADGTRVRLAGDLGETTRAAQARLARLLDRIDAAAEARGFAAGLDPAGPPAPLVLEAPATALDLRAEGIATVIWATGFRRRYPWLHLPLCDAAGEIVQSGGRTADPGVFTLGLPFQRRRKSTFIDGVGGDAEAILVPLLTHLGARPRAAA